MPNIPTNLVLIWAPGGDKIPRRPYDPFPPIYLLQPIELASKGLGALLFQWPHDSCYCIFGGNDEYQMQMVRLDLLLHQFHPRQGSKRFGQDFRQITGHPRIQDATTILGNPDKVLFRSIGTVPRKSDFHAPSLPKYRRRHSPTGIARGPMLC